MAANYRNQELPLILASCLNRELPTVDSTVGQWVVITVDEAYIHCSKHVPRLEKTDKVIRWGADDCRAKSDDYFLKSRKRGQSAETDGS